MLLMQEPPSNFTEISPHFTEITYVDSRFWPREPESGIDFNPPQEFHCATDLAEIPPHETKALRLHLREPLVAVVLPQFPIL